MARRWLKADLHTHTADDPRDTLRYSAEELIDAAAACGVEVLSVTLHETFFWSDRLATYADRRGILLVPGMEQMIEGKHVLILNPDEEHLGCRDFASLRRIGRRDAAIIAPHPYYPAPVCLGRRLEENIDLFDAVEFSTMYCAGINFNRKAIRVARRHNLPVLGTSDTHALPYRDTTLSYVEAEKTVAGVIDGLRSGRIRLETRPRTHASAFKFGMKVALDTLHDAVLERAR